jgi:ATP phosphoribosyltransferase
MLLLLLLLREFCKFFFYCKQERERDEQEREKRELRIAEKYCQLNENFFFCIFSTFQYATTKNTLNVVGSARKVLSAHRNTAAIFKLN